MLDTFSDLELILKRLTRWLNAHVPILDTPNPVIRCPDIVLEMRPVRVDALALPAGKTRWVGTIPDVHAFAESRHWFVKKSIRHQTTISEGMHNAACSHLPELSFWTPTKVAQSLLLLARRDLQALFERERKRSPSQRLLYHENVMEGTYTIFDASGGIHVLYKDAVQLITPAHRGLARLCHEYASMACHMYGLSMQNFAQTTLLSISECEADSGEPLTLQPFSRFNRGPVLSVLLCEELSCLDVSPVLLAGNASPKRFWLKDGTMIAVDGRARLLCAFGLPIQPHARYKLNFYLSMERAVVLHYSQDLCSPVLYTPMRQAKLNTSQTFPDTQGADPVYTTASEAAIHKMHELVLLMESQTSVVRHLARFEARD